MMRQEKEREQPEKLHSMATSGSGSRVFDTDDDGGGKCCVLTMCHALS